MQRPVRRGLVTAALIAAAVSPGCMPQTHPAPGTSGTSVPTGSVALPGASQNIVTAFSRLACTVSPAVVDIRASGTSQQGAAAALRLPPGVEEGPFFRFFQQYSQALASGAAPRTSSGFVTSPDGYILTDANDVAGATRIGVTLSDGRTFRATLVGSDPASGVALLKIRAHNLPVATIGSAADVKPGQWGASIGSPYGLENSVTDGIIASTTRLLPRVSYIPLIQTDLSANIGDAGSPLLNLDGQVIGMELDTPASAGSVQGLAFAVPIDEAMKVEHQLQLHGKAVHGHLGATIQEVTVPPARAFGLPGPVGALVSRVAHDSPAARAGLHAGDVILAVNGNPITDSSQLSVMVADTPPGTTITLSYWRGDASHATRAVPVSAKEAPLTAGQPGGNHASVDGMTVRGLTPDERQAAGISRGVRVEHSTGPALITGIEPGDVVAMVDNVPVSNATQFHDIIAKNSHAIALLVLRHGERLFAAIGSG